MAGLAVQDNVECLSWPVALNGIEDVWHERFALTLPEEIKTRKSEKKKKKKKKRKSLAHCVLF